jgi:hypothetical protein
MEINDRIVGLELSCGSLGLSAILMRRILSREAIYLPKVPYLSM